MAKDRMNVLELLRKEAPDADLDFLREGLRVLILPALASAVRSGSPLQDPALGHPRWICVPKVREGSYFPSLLEPRRRSERALLAVVQQAYVEGVSTRRVENLVQALGRGSPRARSRASAPSWTPWSTPSSAVVVPYPYLWLDARGRSVRGGHRGQSQHDRWAPARTLLRLMPERFGVPHPLHDQPALLPRRAQPWVATMVRTIYQQPSPQEVHAQHARMWACSMSASPKPPSCWPTRDPTSWPSLPFPRSTGGRSGRTTPRSASTRRSDADTWWVSSRTALSGGS